ncbi:MAG: SpoIVB peptidase [Clostridia bacterium]|nr:SpoIVB peptidase [Clostridia bacterium]
MDNKILKIGKRTIGCLLVALLIAINLLPEMTALRNIENGSNIYDVKMLEPLMQGYVPISIWGSDSVRVSGDLSESLGEKSENTVTLKVCGIPVKTVNACVRESVYLMPGGASIGVRLHTQGALIVGFGDVNTGDSFYSRPAQKAGLEAGDIVIEINGEKIRSAKDVTRLCNNESNKVVSVKVIRNGESLDFEVTPRFDITDNEYKLGLWVRDSSIGIGTLSFYRMSDKKFGALGHAITDIDTGALLVAEHGDIVLAEVRDVKKGEQGSPGELMGAFSNLSLKLGAIETNSNKGLYGKMYTDLENKLYPNGLEAGYKDEVKEGEASILSTVSEDGIVEYKCRILKVYRQQDRNEKDMVIEITDKRLLDKTGGIVQGMSGSPIIQDGKLIGAVTHVLVNDPTRGYGIFIENMLEVAG